MKPFHVKPSIYVDFNKENNKESPKFKVHDHVKISEYQNLSANGHIPYCSEEVFIVTKVNNTVPWSYVISDLKGEKTVTRFYKKELQKTN